MHMSEPLMCRVLLKIFVVLKFFWELNMTYANVVQIVHLQY